MMDCLVLIRMTDLLDEPVWCPGEDDFLKVFPDRDAALEWVDKNDICRVRPWQLVELDEL